MRQRRATSTTMTTMALKRRGRVSSGAALAVLVALVALALLSRVDAQFDRLASLRDRVAVALESLPELVDEEGLGDIVALGDGGDRAREALSDAQDALEQLVENIEENAISSIINFYESNPTPGADFSYG